MSWKINPRTWDSLPISQRIRTDLTEMLEIALGHLIKVLENLLVLIPDWSSGWRSLKGQCNHTILLIRARFFITMVIPLQNEQTQYFAKRADIIGSVGALDACWAVAYMEVTKQESCESAKWIR